mgnify:CR=1 FL=1
MYKPLPESLTIKTSAINGLGLFAAEGIGQGTNLGTTHIKVNDKIIRTPLGGFINHSDEANCVKTELRDERYTKKWNLIALRNIKEGEELTLSYTFYNVLIPMTEEEEYRNAGITKEEAETSSKEWIKGYKKWKNESCPHN